MSSARLAGAGYRGHPESEETARSDGVLRSRAQPFRTRLVEASLTMLVLFTPWSPPPRRADPDMRPVAILPIGEPVSPLHGRPRI